MRDRILVSLAALAVVVGSVLVAGAQAPGGSAATNEQKTWTAPKTPDGHPDLQGIWSNSSYTPLERPAAFAGKAFFTEEEAEAFFTEAAEAQYELDPDVHYSRTEYGLDKWQNGVRPHLRTSLIVDPPDGRLPPLTAEAQKRRTSRPALSRTTVKGWPLYTRCITGYWGGLPMLKGGGGDGGADIATGADAEHQIVQTRDYLVIVAQSNNDVRMIPLNDRPHPKTTRYFGHSRGRWEGETLVVETTGFNSQVAFRGQPITTMRLVERFTRVDEDTLLYGFTIDDPGTWTKPWSVEVPWPRVKGPVFEFACHETNYGLLGVVKGTRAAVAMSGATR